MKFMNLPACQWRMRTWTVPPQVADDRGTGHRIRALKGISMLQMSIEFVMSEKTAATGIN